VERVPAAEVDRPLMLAAAKVVPQAVLRAPSVRVGMEGPQAKPG
jgi:hypothetical protein